MSWTFNYTIGGINPMAQLMTAHCVDAATLTVEQPPIQVGMGTDATWLHVAPTSGPTPLQMQLTVSPGTLPAGTYFGHVNVMTTSAPIANGPVRESVTLIVTGSTVPPPTGTVLLVDFGATAAASRFGLIDWTTIIKDTYTDHQAIGPGGTTIVVGDNWTYNYQGVAGVVREFKEGDRLRMTWYNAHNAPLTFTPKIAFQPGRPDVSWLGMTAVTVQPGQSATSEYVMTAATAGLKTVVNVAVNYQNNRLIIADKLEWITGTTPPIEPPPPELPTIRFVTPDMTTFRMNNKEFVVSVSDGVIAVRLFIDAGAIAVCTQAARAGTKLPLNVELQWMESIIPRGTYQLTAVAMDSKGQASIPAKITVKRI